MSIMSMAQEKHHFGPIFYKLIVTITGDDQLWKKDVLI